ncbi:Thiol-disulfide oxidoreductase ResA [uncultured archaeon]|nr:Thiol-disulfide oxidoreductase ResA [uncultured archaeon]
MISLLLLLFAFIAGLFTILAPCIWPLLPIVLSSSVSKTKAKPFGIVLGLCISFLIFTLAISFLIKSLGLDVQVLRLIAVVIIALMGFMLLIPSLYAKLESFVGLLTNKLGLKSSDNSNDFIAGLITGLSLGLVWSPCAGPILATVASLALTNSVNLEIVLIAVVYVIGIGVPLLLLALFGSLLFSKVKALSSHLGLIQKIFGIILILTAILIYTGYDQVLQVQLANALPGFNGFATSIEQNSIVQSGLQNVKQESKGNSSNLTQNIPTTTPQTQFTFDLPNYGVAPELVGITNWLNTDKNLTISSLKGKVILVDFWTYSCINCLRTLPHLTNWYAKYKDQGFVIIGVHTPEFEFEKNSENVANALKQNGITYPVAQDNNYATWNNYQNQYWPAEYLIDANGIVREAHFGEGDYDLTEKHIGELIQEKGGKMLNLTQNITDQTPTQQLTQETYVGLTRGQNFDSNEPMIQGLNEYTLPLKLTADYFAFQGQWNETSEYAVPQPNSILELNFQASKVFLVLKPIKGNEKITVLLDDKPISQEQEGADVKNSILTLDNPRLYELVNLTNNERHDLKLKFNDSVEVYSFTFG